MFCDLYAEEIEFKAILDSNFYGTKYNQIDIFNSEEYLKGYNGESIYVCAWNKSGEICESLQDKGVEDDHIINVAEKIRFTWNECQYFDLEIMKEYMSDEEVFVDGGCYDGGNSKAFLKWCNGKYDWIYAYEPEKDNYIVCKEKVDCIAKEKYTLFQKGLWSTETELY